MRKKKLWNRILQRFLALGLSVALVGSDVLPVFATENAKASYILGSDITEEQFKAALEEDLELYPDGRFEFFVSQLETDESGEKQQLVVVRRGGTEKEATVDFKAVDISATYGEDYQLTVETSKGKKKLKKEDKTEGSISVGDISIVEKSVESEETTPSQPEAMMETEEPEEVLTTLSSGKKVSNGTSLQAAKDTYLGTESSSLNWQQLDEAQVADEEKKTEEYNAAYNEFATEVEGISYTFTFKEGEYMKSVYIDTIDDNLSESDEQVMFLLSNASVGEADGVTTGYLNIKDNDEEEPVIFAMDTDSITVDRSEGKAEIVINRVSGINMMAGVTVGTGGETAKAGADYEAVKKEVFFAQGVTSQTVEIPLLDYAGAPKEAVFQVALDANAALVQENCAITTVTLTDNDEAVTETGTVQENVPAEGAGELVPATEGSEDSEMSADAASQWVDQKNVSIAAQVSGREDAWSGRKRIWSNIDLTTASKIEIHWKSNEGSYDRGFWWKEKYTRDTYLYLNGKTIMYRAGEHTGWQTFSYTLTEADKCSGSYLDLETKTYGGNKNATSRVDWVKVYYPGYQFTINNSAYTDGTYSNQYTEKIFCDDAEATKTTKDGKHRYKEGNTFTIGQAKVIKNGSADSKADSIVVHRAATDTVTIVNEYATKNKNSNGIAISPGSSGNVYLAGYQLKQPNGKSWSGLILPEDLKFTKDFVKTYGSYLHTGNEFIIRPVYRPFEVRVQFRNFESQKGSYANGFATDDVLRCTMLDTIHATVVANKGYSVAGFSLGAHRDGNVHMSGLTDRKLAERANNYYNHSDNTIVSEAKRVSAANYQKSAISNAKKEGAINNKIIFTPTAEFVYLSPIYSTPTIEVLIDPKNNQKDKGVVVYTDKDDPNGKAQTGDYKNPLVLQGVTLNQEYTFNAIATDGYKAYFKNFTGDADKDGVITTSEEGALKKYNYNFVRTASNGNAYTFRPVMDFSLVYYGFMATTENRYPGYIDGVVTLRDKPVFGDKTTVYAINGAQVSVAGTTVSTKTDEKYGGVEGNGGDGYFTITNRDFVAGENQTINITYNNVMLTATQAVNAAGIYELDAYDGIGISEAKVYQLDGKNAKEIVPGSITNGDKIYRIYVATTAKNDSVRAKKAIFRFYRSDGTEIENTAQTVESDNGVFNMDFNPATLKIVPGATMSVQFVDQNGNKYFEHEMGFIFGEALGILSFLSSFNFGGAEKAIEIIGVVDSAFNFGWDGDITDMDQVNASADGSVITISVGFKKEFDKKFEGDKEATKTPKNDIKEAAKNAGTTKEQKANQKKAADLAVDNNAKGNKTKASIGGGASVSLRFALEINLVKDQRTTISVTENGETKDVENKDIGKYYFGNMLLAANVDGGADVTMQYMTPIGIPIRVGVSVGASGAATFVIDQNYNKDIYYISQVTDTATRKVDLFNFNMKNGDNAFDAYGIFNIAPYLDLRAGVGTDSLNVEVGGRATFDMTFYTRSDQKNNGNVTFSAYIQMKVLFISKKWTIATTTLNMFGDAASLEDMTGDVDYTHESLSTMGVDERTYWTNVSKWMGTSEMMAQSVASTSGITENILKKGVNPNPDIQIQSLSDGSYLAVFLDDNTSEDKYNCTHVYYTVGDGTTWSEPKVIEADGTLDDAPSIFDLGEKGIYVSWSTADRLLKEEDTLIDSLNSMNIHGAFFDVATKKFGEIQEVTYTAPYSYVDEDECTICDNVADVTSHVSYDAETNRMIMFYNKTEYASTATDDEGLVGDITGAYTVVAYRVYNFATGEWIAEYSAEEDMGEDYTKAWYGQRFLDLAPLASIQEELDEEGYWVKEPVISPFVKATYTDADGAVMEQDPIVVETTTATYNGLALLTYVLDYDGNKNTANDQDVYMQIYNYKEDSFTHPIMLTNTPSVSESNLQVVKNGKGLELNYLADNTIYSIDLSNTVQGLKKTDINGQPLYYVDKTKSSSVGENVYSYAKPGIIVGEKLLEEANTEDVKVTEEERDTAITDYKVMSTDNYVYYIWTKMDTKTKSGIAENSEESIKPENRVSESQVYICRYDIVNQQMTSPVQVTDEEGANYGYLDFVVDNGPVGTVKMLATKAESKVETLTVETETGETKTVEILGVDENNTSMAALDFTPVSTLTVQNMYINELSAGTASNVHMELYNDGLETLTDLILSVKDEAGEEVYTTTIQKDEDEQTTDEIIGGDVYGVDFPIYLREDEKGCKLTYIVKDKEGKVLAEDTYTEEIPLKLDVNNLEVTTNERGTLEFAVEVTNNSRRAVSGEKITISKKINEVDEDYTELTSVVTDDLQPGQSQYMEFTYKYDDYKDLFRTFILEGEESLTALTYFKATTAGEGTSATDEVEMEANKEQRLRMQAIQNVAVLDGTYKEITGAYKLDKGEVTQLNTAVESLAYSGSRYEGMDDKENYDKTNTNGLKVMYTSDNENVIKVYDDGYVEAVGTGNATVKAYVMPANNKITYNSEDGTVVEDNYATLPQEAILTKDIQMTVGNVTPVPTKPVKNELSNCTVTLSKASYNWDGKAKKPTVTVKNALGKTLVENQDYTVTYARGRKNLGTYKVTITGKGAYTGIVEKSFDIKVVKNQSYKVGSYTYKVTKNYTKNGAGEVTVTKGKSKTMKSIKIADTVKIGGKKFNVTAIGNNAFKGYSKVTKVTIGKNIKSIGSNAFRGCSKLKTITIKSKNITKVGTKAISGIHEKAVIKVPASKAKSYKKKFTGKTGYKSTMKIK